MLNNVEHEPIYLKTIKIDLGKFFRKMLDMNMQGKLGK